MATTNTGRSVSANELHLGSSPQALCTASRHGTRAAYARGCRCELARRAYVRYQKAWKYDTLHGRPRRVPVVGAQRRIHALMANGWSLTIISARLGRRGRLNLARQTAVSASLHARIVQLYDELADQRGPSATTAAFARTNGWLGPLWWDDDTIDDPLFINNIHFLENKEWEPNKKVCTPDEVPVHGCQKHPFDYKDTIVDLVAVERVVSGDRSVKLTRAERQAAFEQLRQLHTLGATCERLGISGTTGQRLEAVRTAVSVMRSDDTAGTTRDLEETG